mmetsp:Transcript_35366/g.75386  ORF Transcript_35366/g.75386 Transcript_35366/m.75386 type:complete len:222 (-) Transcript_35366:31-696(-)
MAESPSKEDTTAPEALTPTPPSGPPTGAVAPRKAPVTASEGSASPKGDMKEEKKEKEEAETKETAKAPSPTPQGALEDVPPMVGADDVDDEMLLMPPPEDITDVPIETLKSKALDRMLAGCETGALDKAFADMGRPDSSPGFRVKGGDSTSPAENSQLAAELKDLKAEVEALRKENQRLKQENEALRGAQSESTVKAKVGDLETAPAGSAVNAVRASQGSK